MKTVSQEIIHINDSMDKKIDNIHLKVLIYEHLLNCQTDGFLAIDTDGKIIDINQAYCDYLGIDRKTTIGKPVLSVIPNTKMLEVIKERRTDLDFMHTLPDALTPSGEKMVCVSRMPVLDGNRAVAAVASIKFSQHTINLANTLHRLEDEVKYYRQRLSRYAISSFEDLPSTSHAYLEAKHLAERFADSDLPILLLGETGVGKEVFANAIHQASDRAGQPFVAVNCASIPSELLESELFGYVDGAFTGSRRSGKKGKFEIADGGTLFLDEIGEMTAQLQSKLLRVLQNQTIEKLGSEKSIKVNVRIISATNQDVINRIETKEFRSDLYYRINVLTITIPPLRDRIEDLEHMANVFLNDLIAQYGRKVSISPKSMSILKSYSWPGNVRELRNAIGRGFMLANGREIHPEHLPDAVRNQNREKSCQTMHGTMQQAQNDVIIKCLAKYNGNFAQAANELGIHRTTLYSRVRAMGVNIKDVRANFDRFVSGSLPENAPRF